LKYCDVAADKSKSSPRRHGEKQELVFGTWYLAFAGGVESFCQIRKAAINHKYQLPNTNYLSCFSPCLRGVLLVLALLEVLMHCPLRVFLRADDQAVAHMDDAVADAGGGRIVGDHQDRLSKLLVGLTQHF